MSASTTSAAAPAAAPAGLASGRTFVRLFGRFRAVLHRSLGVLALLLVRTALEIASPYLVGETIASLTAFAGKGGSLPPEFVERLTWLAAVLLARSALTFVSAAASASVAQDVENRLRSDLLAKVTRLRFRWHDQNRSGKTIARSLRDMERAKAFYREVAFGYVETALILLAAVAMSFHAHWTYGLAVGTISGVAVALSVLVARHVGRMDRSTSDLYDHVTTVLQENVAGARVVRAFGREPEESGKFGGRLGAFTGSWRGQAWFWTSVMPIVNHGYNLAIPAALVLGVLRVSAGVAPLETLIAQTVTVVLYVRMIRDRVRPLTRVMLLGQEAVASASRVFEVLDNPDVDAPPARAAALPEAGSGRPLGDLRLEDVCFAYPGGEPVLSGVSLHVPAGGSLGILGPTGAGKTTLVQLLPRFYDPQAGRITLDGVDVRDLPLPVLRRAVGLVFQEPFLFSASVAENVAYGRPDLSRADVERAARLAAAHEFVARLPNGYDTVIGERGVSLSGGQRQRLTIARAVAADPRVLVFDDATASVDAVTERELFQGIRAAAAGRTTLVISQRVTSVAWCDRVAVVEGGRVTAVGTHADLMRESALYREVHEHQRLRAVGTPVRAAEGTATTP
jgi:ATP-binding cassette subfamily B protein